MAPSGAASARSTNDAEQRDEVVRCATWARREAVDPIGSAGIHVGYLLIEWPLPWPEDIGESPALGDLVGALSGTGIRLQGLVPSSSEDGRRVILYRAAEHGAANGGRFVRFERQAEHGDLVAAALELLAVPGEEASDDIRGDVLVCTHGSRDRCCGSRGTTLFMELASALDAWPSGIRLWRTSHTGGHRFAPTAIVLPEATSWAYLDADALTRVVSGEGDLADLLPRYRGYAGLTSPRIQAIERAVLGETGWPLFGDERFGTELSDDVVELTALHDGTPSTWRATVTTKRELPVPVCGESLSAAKKWADEYHIGPLELIG